MEEPAGLVLDELSRTLAAVDVDALNAAAALIFSGRRIFAAGAGRSLLALRMAAMRLMHFGLPVHVMGDTTTPAIGKGDVLLAVSGSGTTSTVVHAADVAAGLGAAIVVVTAAPGSRLAQAATVVVTIDAAGKLDHSGAASRQYGGSLFEQAVLLILDALFHAAWQASGTDAATLWSRHANLE